MMPFSPAALQVMSHDSVAIEAIETAQPVAPREHVSPIPELHPRLCEQLAQARLAAAGSLELAQLLPLISSYYEQLDDVRRARSATVWLAPMPDTCRRSSITSRTWSSRSRSTARSRSSIPLASACSV